MRKRAVTWLAVAVGSVLLVAPSSSGQHDPLLREQAARDEQIREEEEARAAAQREKLAEEIIAREEGASGRVFDSAFRTEAKRGLAALSQATLEAQMQRVGLGPYNLGDAKADLVYTPITPCRIIDTRLVGGAIAGGATRDFFVTGDTTSQGGTNCAIPNGVATAAAINFVAVGPTGAGDLRATPFGTPMPLASIINYAAVAGLNVANGLVVALCDPSTTTCTRDITVQADASATHVVADVQGYFRNVRREQVKSVHLATRYPGAPKALTTTCSNYWAFTATNAVPARIGVRVNVAIQDFHTQGVSDEADIYIGTTPTDCTLDFGYAEFTFVQDVMPSSAYYAWLHPSYVYFNVAPGTHVYYLNGFRSGTPSQNLYYASVDITVTPE